jgi:hypothetical protein
VLPDSCHVGPIAFHPAQSRRDCDVHVDILAGVLLVMRSLDHLVFGCTSDRVLDSQITAALVPQVTLTHHVKLATANTQFFRHPDTHLVTLVFGVKLHSAQRLARIEPIGNDMVSCCLLGAVRLMPAAAAVRAAANFRRIDADLPSISVMGSAQGIRF